ncbi:MAG: LrgB family protein [Chthoniobacteraceae bacterium]
MKTLLHDLFWAAVTVGIYLAALRLNRRLAAWWTSPLLITWAFCALLLFSLHTTYQEYLGGTNWLIFLIGPATVAFAIPIHEHRLLIRRHWGLLLLGTLTGSAIALGSGYLLARYFQFPPELRASLLPRSITTPLAMTASQNLGGLPDLTAAFTTVTGLFGAAIGESFLIWLPFRSSFARGALLGMGAHGAGVARARELGEEEGAVAGLMMIFAGLLNVLGTVVFFHRHQG